jgi:hypothetical protein
MIPDLLLLCFCTHSQFLIWDDSRFAFTMFLDASGVIPAAKLESCKMRPKTKRKQIWNHPRLKTVNASKSKMKANLESSD